MSTMQTHADHSHVSVERWNGVDEPLPAVEGLPPTRHKHEEMDLHAINVAIAAGRPLLVRGEPGTGKSQLARAAAHRLGRRFAWRVMDSQAKITDLFYEFDAVGRLAQAQVVGALCNAGLRDPKDVEALLDERRFVQPGPLWWAFDAAGARKWIGGKKDPADAQPYVVLIDEIDKTDSSVPNGLLEALGQGTFSVLRDKARVSLHAKGRPAPLVIITSNDERELPPAFLRRCIVRYIRLPTAKTELEAWLVARGRTHFPKLSSALLEEAATLVQEDRAEAEKQGLPPPGQAEYLDLLRAVTQLAKGAAARSKLLRDIQDLALKKHPDLHPRGSGGSNA